MINRLLCSPTLQRLYARVRQLPVVGGLSHRLTTKFLPQGTRLIVTVRSGVASGLTLCVDPRFEAQYAAGLHEDALMRCLASHLRLGDVFYDVGAHVGLISLVGARLVGSQGKVYAFEADPANSARLLEHIEINALQQVELVEAAVWSERKVVAFRQDSTLSSRNTGGVLEVTEKQCPTGSVEVQALTLNDFTRDHRLPAVVKVDVEGGEVQVLRGGDKIFRTSRPILICEVHSARAADEVFQWLKGQQYEWSWLTDREEFPRHFLAKGQKCGLEW